LGFLQFDEAEIEFVAGYTTTERASAARTETRDKVTFKIATARRTKLHAMGSLDLKSCTFERCVFGKDLEAEAQSLGIDAGEWTETDAHLGNTRGPVLLSDEGDTFEDGGGNSDFVH
jgi:hypothetical protein